MIKVIYKSNRVRGEYMNLISMIREDFLKGKVDKLYLRMTQDKIYFTRLNDIITPRFLRNALLGSNNKYREEVKKFIKETTVKADPKTVRYNPFNTSTDIPVYSLDYKKEYNMKQVQDRLLEMLKILKDICDRNNIEYIIDGGTLLGAFRGKTFLPWDDDIDIGIPYWDRKRFYKILKEQLPEGYNLQSYYDDKSYSPLLAKFRIRDDSTEVKEKLNNSSFNFKEKGIFVDIYAYDYSLKALFLDKLYRQVIMLPLNFIISKLDKGFDGKLQLKLLKSLYILLEKLYSVLPKSKKYISYSPSYIYKAFNPGPYFNAEGIFDKSYVMEFEGLQVKAPGNKEDVLEKCYGKDFRIPNKKYVTVLQHWEAVDL